MTEIETKKWLQAQENVAFLRTLESAFCEAENREIVFLCVGNAKIWYDSFGPMLGTLLMHLDVERYIYGNTRYSIVASNICEFVEMIYRFHINPFVVVVDSAISCEHEGLLIKRGKTTCAALSKNPIEVGDLSITFSLKKESFEKPETKNNMLLGLKKAARFVLFALSNFDKNHKN